MKKPLSIFLILIVSLVIVRCYNMYQREINTPDTYTCKGANMVYHLHGDVMRSSSADGTPLIALETFYSKMIDNNYYNLSSNGMTVVKLEWNGGDTGSAQVTTPNGFITYFCNVSVEGQ